MGRVKDGKLYQAKGFPYTLTDLLGDEVSKTPWVDGLYLTIRITSSMYHRFHAPFDGRLTHVKYFSGDTWNVNPVALARVEKLFCKNERALLNLEIGPQAFPVALVPVAAAPPWKVSSPSVVASPPSTPCCATTAWSPPERMSRAGSGRCG
jgi:phosphatidylserine decarboxylase